MTSDTLSADSYVALKDCVRVVETEAGALVVNEATYVASEVNVSGRIVLTACVRGASYASVVRALAKEARCEYDEADAVVREFLTAADAEGWILIAARSKEEPR